MSTSPPIEIKGNNPEMNARPKLAYLAQLFNATLRSRPIATLQIFGTSHYYNDQIARALEKLQVPRHKIMPLAVSNPFASIGVGSSLPTFNGQQSASVYIDYPDGKTGKQKFSVEFKPDDKQFPIEVEFEVSPEGTMVEAIEAGWTTPLTATVADSARLGVRNVNFSTKLIGAAGFERTTLNKIEMELKAKAQTNIRCVSAHPGKRVSQNTVLRRGKR